MWTARSIHSATLETINLELILADMETIEKRIDKAKKNARGGDKSFLAEAELLERVQKHLEAEKPVRSMTFTKEEQEIIDAQFLLTSKPVIYAAISTSRMGSIEPST